MKGFKILVNNVLPSTLYLCAILLGIVAALLSAVIEYSFFRDFFIHASLSDALSSQATPLLIVIALEGSKLCLSVYLQHITVLPNKHFGPSHRLAKILRYSLVAVSIICTFAWTTNLLYTDMVTGTDKYSEDINLLKRAYEADISNLRNSQNKEEERLLASSKQHAESAWKEYHVYEVVLTPKVEYERSQAEKLRLFEVAKQAQTEYEAEIERIHTCVTEQINSQISVRTQHYKDECAARIAQATDQHEGANPYLHVLLTAISKYLFHAPTYSTFAYFTTGLGFSVALAFLLEGLISLNLGYVSMTSADWDTLLNTKDLSAEDQDYLRNWIRFLSSAIVSTLMYLVFCMLFQLTVNARSLLMVIMLYTAINLIMDFFQRTEGVQLSLKPQPNPPYKKKYAPMIAETIVKACTSFVGFVLLGILFGSDFPELTLPAVGMSLGSVGGQLIRLPNKCA